MMRASSRRRWFALAKATGVLFRPMSTLRYCTNCGRELVPSGTRKCAVCDAPVPESAYSPRARVVGEKTSDAARFDKGITIAVRVVAGIVVAIASTWYFFGGGLEQHAAIGMQRIENQVASDSVKQYEIAKRDGSPMDACVHAGMVAAAYLQAKDEPNYQQWKATERADCAAAGLPGQ